MAAEESKPEASEQSKGDAPAETKPDATKAAPAQDKGNPAPSPSHPSHPN